MRPVNKMVFIILGSLSLIAGVLGILLPIIPGTPFIILGAGLFLRGSKKTYNWLINLKYVGKFIKELERGARISLKVKVVFIIFIWAALSISMYFFVTKVTYQVMLALFGLFMTWKVFTTRSLIKR
ncbi:MAG: YbaN family protein [Halanaerobium sp.]|nr:YbaN family protein [Halanaerobium sp.]